jgi:serpin B
MLSRVRTHELVLIAFLVVTVAGCGDERVCPTPGGDENGPDGLVLTQDQLISANNQFAFGLFKEIVETQPDSNIFISPLSISMALGMTANGAAHATLDSMLATLGFSGYSIESADQCYRNLIDLLTGLDPAVTFEIANSIWARKGTSFQASFLQACQTYFDAEVRSLDFTQPDAPDTINAWVNDKTHGKITEIVPKPMDDSLAMILLNAIYFLADWKYQFDPRDTKDDWFYPPQGSKTACRMMSRPRLSSGSTELSADFSVVLEDDFQAVDLPYGDSLFTMTLILPRGQWDADAAVSWLNDDHWTDLAGSFHTCHGTLLMPRFELKYSSSMNDVLKALGMAVAFSDAADFTNLFARGGLCITNVRHKTYVRVDEVGTEAAAVTEVEIGPTSVPPECQGFVIKVDHPFVLVIRENRTNTILFMGKIANPGYFVGG